MKGWEGDAAHGILSEIVEAAADEVEVQQVIRIGQLPMLPGGRDALEPRAVRLQ